MIGMKVVQFPNLAAFLLDFMARDTLILTTLPLCWYLTLQAIPRHFSSIHVYCMLYQPRPHNVLHFIVYPTQFYHQNFTMRKILLRGSLTTNVHIISRVWWSAYPIEVLYP